MVNVGVETDLFLAYFGRDDLMDGLVSLDTLHWGGMTSPPYFWRWLSNDCIEGGYQDGCGLMYII